MKRIKRTILPDTPMPLSFAVRSIALGMAVKHCGETTVNDGNLYRELKLEQNQLTPMTHELVIQTAVHFEKYLWGNYSKSIVTEAMDTALDEAEEAIEERAKKHGVTLPFDRV